MQIFDRASVFFSCIFVVVLGRAKIIVKTDVFVTLSLLWVWFYEESQNMFDVLHRFTNTENNVSVFLCGNHCKKSILL